MIKSELIDKVSEANPHLTRKEIEKIVNTVLTTISSALESGDRVELRGFGTFLTQKRDARTARNPRTGEEVPVPAKTAIKFKAGKEILTLINEPKKKAA